VKLLFAAAFVCLAPPLHAASNLDQVLHGVEQRYNRVQTLKLAFTESYSGARRPTQTESGTLWLRKPGRMRWDYVNPPGKFFLSDGKALYLFTPDDQKVEKSALRDSEDMRAPLAFLLGKLNFYKEFRKFDLRPEGNATWISAEPNSDALPYSRVEFLVTPDSQIHRVRVTGQDHSVITYVFEQEELNPALNSALFTFRAPPGSQIVEAEH
jgi:outer membrane lipoprotein carrier protein